MLTIQKKYWGDDVESSEWCPEIEISHDDLPYFRELQEQGVGGADVIVKAIVQYGYVHIWVE